MKKILFFALFSFIIQSNIAQSIAKTQQKTEIINVNAKDFEKLLKKEAQPQLIDIRTPREFAMGHIAGAKNINFYDPRFKENIEKAGLDKNKPIYLYCRSGNRSSRSLAVFESLGFKKIIHLMYGINDWYRNGLPLTK